MKDIFEKLTAKMGPIGEYMHQSYGYFTFPKLEGELGPHMTFRGKLVLNWSLNNYLGLANHQEVRKVDAAIALKYGMAYPMGSRVLTGNTEMHETLEAMLSAKTSREDAMLLNFGYQGVVSCIDALLSRHDIALYDSQSHACIIDGLRLHQGKRISFKHNDIEDLEKKLQSATKTLEKTEGGIVVITEGVFGMNGHQGMLKEIAALKNKYSFRFFIDDAHGFGYMGETGAGTDEAQGCQKDVDLYFSTFVKSMSSIGAFISSNKDIISYLRYNMRSQIYAKSLPTLVVEGMIERLRIIEKTPTLKRTLWEITHALQNGLKKNGFNIGNTTTPVTPVYMEGCLNEASNMSVALREEYGIFCSIVVPPVIPAGNIIYRLIPTAMHTQEDVARTLHAFNLVRKELEKEIYDKEFPHRGILPTHYYKNT